MARIFTFVCILLHCGLMVDSLPAQLRGYGAPPAAREPARVGLLGGLREAREERFRREAQAAAAAARAASPAARNPNANQLSNPTANPNANAARSNNFANAANNSAANNSNANNLLRRDPAASNSRTANYGTGYYDAPNYGAANYGAANSRASNLPSPVRAPNLNPPASQNPGYANNLSNRNPSRESSYVAPASANTFVPSPMRAESDYSGPGVTIRLPANARGVVNYLIDNIENSTVRPGEEQVLDSKGSYVIRYSRGVTADGRSFGESRYTVTEGVYRFELTSNGWELYRESDADNRQLPPNRLDLANEPANEDSSRQSLAEGSANRSLFDLPTPRAGSRELQDERLATESAEAERNSASRSEAKPSQKATEPEPPAEELPAPKPRSILEN